MATVLYIVAGLNVGVFINIYKSTKLQQRNEVCSFKSAWGKLSCHGHPQRRSDRWTASQEDLAALYLCHQELFGNLPPIEELPVNSLIGFFDYYSHTSSVDKESIWVAGLDETACIVCNAHMFDHPIRLPKEIIDNINDIDEMVPSHVCSPKKPFLLGMNDELVIDVSDKYFAIAARGGSFSLEYSVELSNLLHEKLDDIKVITLRNGIKNKGFIFKYDLIYDYVDGSNEVYKMYPSVLTPDHKMFRAQLMLSFDEPLIE